MQPFLPGHGVKSAMSFDPPVNPGSFRHSPSCYVIDRPECIRKDANGTPVQHPRLYLGAWTAGSAQAAYTAACNKKLPGRTILIAPNGRIVAWHESGDGT